MSGTLPARRRRHPLAVLLRVPTTERIDWAYGVAILVLRPLLSALTRRTWRGAEHIPREGGVILVANHISHIDPLTLAQYLIFAAGRLPRFLAKIEIFGVPVIGAIMRGAKQLAVDRHAPTAALALEDAVQALRRGSAVLFYPEGTVPRDGTGWPGRTKTGVARLALLSGAPVIPIAQWGPQHLYDVRGRWYQGLSLSRTDIVVEAGPPVDLSAYRGREITPEVLREVTGLIMARITDQLAGLRGEEAPPSPGFDEKRSA